jgi:hypothetical protein
MTIKGEPMIRPEHPADNPEHRQTEDSHVSVWRRSDQWRMRPFRFEDLYGEPDPVSWGPAYPKTASAAVEKWRSIERVRELTTDEAREYGAAVGAWIRGLNKPPGYTKVPMASTEFNAARHRAKLIAAFHARASADRRAWANGDKVGWRHDTIQQAYAAAMDAKRRRLAAGAPAPTVAPLPLPAPEPTKATPVPRPMPPVTMARANVIHVSRPEWDRRAPPPNRASSLEKNTEGRAKPAPDRSAAAKRAWVTIRANRAAAGIAPAAPKLVPAPDRSTAAKKAWITIRANRAARAAQQEAG